MKKGGRPPKFPWRKLAVGESFYIPGRTTDSLKGCVHHLDAKFRFKTLMKDGTKGVRVWRIA